MERSEEAGLRSPGGPVHYQVLARKYRPRTFDELVGQDHVVRTLRNAIASGRSTCSYEYRFRCRDGSYATVSDRAFIIPDDTGQPIRALGAMTDITERVRAEEALRESREEFTSAFRDASIGMALVETNGKWRQVNRALCDIVAQQTYHFMTIHPQSFDQRRPQDCVDRQNEIEN